MHRSDCKGSAFNIGLLAVLLISPVVMAQSPPESLFGSWASTAAYCRNGIRPLSLKQRFTFIGQEKGNVEMERTLNFDDAKSNTHFRCKGFLKGNYSATNLANGMKVLHITSGRDIAGPDCRQDAGSTQKLPDADILIDLRLDVMTVVTDGATECPGEDLLIVVYKRSSAAVNSAGSPAVQR